MTAAATGVFGSLRSFNYRVWAAGALIVIGVAALTFTNATNSLMQLSTEPAMRGRVIALGGTPIGAPIVGWIADHPGPRWSLGIGAAAGFTAAVVAAHALTQQVHRRRQSGPEGQGHDLH